MEQVYTRSARDFCLVAEREQTAAAAAAAFGAFFDCDEM